MTSMEMETDTGDKASMAANPTLVLNSPVDVPRPSHILQNNTPIEDSLKHQLEAPAMTMTSIKAEPGAPTTVPLDQHGTAFVFPVKIKTEPLDEDEASTEPAQQVVPSIPIKIKTEPSDEASTEPSQQVTAQIAPPIPIKIKTETWEASTGPSQQAAASIVTPIKIKTEPSEPSTEPSQQAAASMMVTPIKIKTEASDVLPSQPPATTTSDQSNSNSDVSKTELATVMWKELVLDNVLSPPEKLRRYAPMPRHGHKAAAIDDYMIVFGGGNEGIFGEVIVFDTRLQEWFKPLVRGEIPPGRAAFGMAIHERQRKMYIFGGMQEYGNYSNDLYELNLTNWVWRRLIPENSNMMPCVRMGHSFTLVANKIFLFGGLTNVSGDPHTNIPQYLNDLHVFDPVPNQPHGAWLKLITFGSPPSPRESHSAVAYSSKDGRYNKLIVFGGMCGSRLGDLYVLDIDTFMWSKMGYMPYCPSPRSLHSACLIGQRMYVFGGWIDSGVEELDHSNRHKLPRYDKWKCSNELTCLNVETMTWTMIHYPNKELPGAFALPRPRAGHCAAVVNNRMFVWSGRDGYKRRVFDAKENGMLQICCEDMWVLDVPVPFAPANLKRLPNRGGNTANFSWEPIPGVKSYIIQCMRSRVDNITTNSTPAAVTNATAMPIRPQITQPTQQFQGIRIPQNAQASGIRFQQMKFPLPTSQSQIALMQNQRMNRPSSSGPMSTQLQQTRLPSSSQSSVMQLQRMRLLAPSSQATSMQLHRMNLIPPSSQTTAATAVQLQQMSLLPSSSQTTSTLGPLQRLSLMPPPSQATAAQLHRMNQLPPTSTSQATSVQLQRISLMPPPSRSTGMLHRVNLVPPTYRTPSGQPQQRLTLLPPPSQTTSTSVQLQRMSLHPPPGTSAQVQRFSRPSTSQTASTQLQLVTLPKTQGSASVQVQQFRLQQASMQLPPQFRRVGPSSSQPISMTQLQAVRLAPTSDGKLVYYLIGTNPPRLMVSAPPRPSN